MLVNKKGKMWMQENHMSEQSMTGTPVDRLAAERMGIPVSELTQERVEEYQLSAFRNVLKKVKKESDYYRETLKDTESDKIISMKDIENVPLTEEKDLAGNEWRFQCVNASDVSRIVTIPTTGTRGKQKRLSYTAADQQKSIDFIRCGYLTMGCRKGERMLVYMSGNTPGSIGDLVKQAIEPIGMQIDVFGEVTDISSAYEHLMEYRPSVIEAIPWHAAAIARYGQKYGNPEKKFIRSVNLSADIVPDMVADRLRRLWDCTVHRHYGSTEMCIFGGVECIHQGGYHLRPCDILLEIPDTDENGMGEIIITTMTHEAMPLIRYKTGDIGRFINEPCGCGTRIRRLEKVWGRDSSILHVKDASFFLTELADIVYEQDESVDFNAYIITDPYGDDRLKVVVYTFPGDEVDIERMGDRFGMIPGVAKEKSSIEVLWEKEDFSAFPGGYNLKKTIRKIGGRNE